jgi:hypothetical protein
MNYAGNTASNMANLTNQECYSPDQLAYQNGVRTGRNRCIEIFKKYVMSDSGADFGAALKAFEEMKEVGK